jgi:drug/metabolite transporter (DMT)-like permease
MKRSDWLWTFAIYFGADFSSDQNFALVSSPKMRSAVRFLSASLCAFFLARRFELPPTHRPCLLFAIQTACSPHFLN